MAGREGRHRGETEASRSERQTTVVGSKLSDTSSLFSRRLPKGGIREDGGLSETGHIGGEHDEGGRSLLRTLALVAAVLAAVIVVVTLALFVLSRTSLFTIERVVSRDTEHVAADTIVQLAAVEDTETLLNVDVARIENDVRKNPWVASVGVERLFPDTLRILAHERQAQVLVSMGSGGLAWLLGADDVWIEPVRIEVGSDESMSDAALREAEQRGLLLITDVPATVNPVAGSQATDKAISAVQTYREQLSAPFASEVVAFSAASEDDISCILRNGVEVSFGSITSIDTKEQVAQGILSSWEGQVIYINVRVPSRPTYRRVNSEYVREGTGATGSSFDVSAIVSTDDGTEEETEGEQEKEDGEDQETAAGTLGNRSGHTREDVTGTGDAGANDTGDTDGYGANTYDSDSYGYDYGDDTYDSYDSGDSY